MKAYEVQQFGIRELALVEREMPTPARGEVLIRFHAASLNYRDLMVVNGTYNPRMKMPAVPFSDGAGEIADVGYDVTNWKRGDRVMPLVVQGWIDGQLTEDIRRTSIGAGAFHDGVLREYGVFPGESVVRVPEHLSFAEASTLPCAALTAWHALVVSGGLKAGQRVLTLGSGGVSIFAVQFAKMLGARIISTSGSDEKLEKLRDLGSDETINYRDHEDWDRIVRDLTGNTGVDHVIEVGGEKTLGRSLNAVRMGGHIALIGTLTGSAGVDLIPIFMKGIKMQGIFIGSRAMFEQMCQAVEADKLEPVIDSTFDFDEVREALEYLQRGEHFGKIVVRI